MMEKVANVERKRREMQLRETEVKTEEGNTRIQEEQVK